MKRFALLVPLVVFFGAGFSLDAETEVRINLDKLGKSLGGWEGKSQKFAEYKMADNKYRTFKPDITPTPDGGVYVSVRIDYVRGLFASNDHAVLELTLDKSGQVQSTRSSVNIQGKKVTSDLISSGAKSVGSATAVLSPADMVLSLSSSLVANLAEKLGNENRVESGRVAFPAAVQHNFNLVYRAVDVVDVSPKTATESGHDGGESAESDAPAGDAEHAQGEAKSPAAEESTSNEPERSSDSESTENSEDGPPGDDAENRLHESPQL